MMRKLLTTLAIGLFMFVMTGMVNAATYSVDISKPTIGVTYLADFTSQGFDPSTEHVISGSLYLMVKSTSRLSDTSVTINLENNERDHEWVHGRYYQALRITLEDFTLIDEDGTIEYIVTTYMGGAYTGAGAFTIETDGTAVPVDQEITGFTSTPPSGEVGASSTLNATASSGLAVTFGSSTPSVCTVTGSTVSYLIVGTCTVTANQAGDANYNAAPQVTLNIDVAAGLTDQVITNFVAAPSTGVVNGSSTLSATGGASGNPVIFGSNTLAVCTVAGSTVTYVTAGTCTVTANQAGDANYNAASQATLDITVAKADQTITGLTVDLASRVVGGTSTLSIGGGAVAHVAQSGQKNPTTKASGIPVTFGSNTLTVCTVSGSTVSYLAAGTCTVTADQAGDANYNPAPQVTLDINVTAPIADVPIPTLSRWGLIAMFLMMLAIGGMVVRRKTRS